MANISPTIKVDISAVPSVVENTLIGENCPLEKNVAYKDPFQDFFDVFTWFYLDMPRFDPTIVEHHTDTWSYAIPLYKEHWPNHLDKAPIIKFKIDKISRLGFIYPIAHTI